MAFLSFQLSSFVNHELLAYTILIVGFHNIDIVQFKVIYTICSLIVKVVF